MSAYVPHGPHEPFSKDRAYGQEPGFVSRHAGKIFLALAVVVIVGVAIVLWVSFGNGGANDPYGDNQEQPSQQ